MTFEKLPQMIKEKQKEYKVKKMFEKIVETIFVGIENGKSQSEIPYKKEDLEEFIEELEEQHILIFIDPETEKIKIDWGTIG
ncbi:hypothetical protein CKN86_07645 [Carnobacterium divergens]|uniref:hypothetical protein n=1 Tax=Carnobacterium divergens TaxID=2748 RepID=UPI000D4E43F2|nr:hypothetical protein [Carnobacterium divergens]MCO6019368.1 hypothetical protein [Carnobacterium divergens]TFI61724.1 hypothetical protein CKN62_07785 [Carnobacterium divergens]TFI88996.1 hypothetical protein CKN84_07675 [Carnobacterium divergens]TFJ03148.1 hypothetical protein CKN86_07645 [Carnobacterium divergens]TFJ05309.1 hypothetical protein CKN65_07685 [Carnobacterium divergens]